MTTPRHAAWLLDLDGTLYRPFPVKLAMAAELALWGWGALSVIRAFRREHERLHHELGNEPSLRFEPSPFAEQVRRTARALGIAEEAVARLVERWMIERPSRWLRMFRRQSLLDELTRHRASGLRTAVVSDYPARRKLSALGIAHLIDDVVANGEHPDLTRLKPSPEGYLLAAERLGVRPSECLVIGDRTDLDGAAARAAGMEFRLIR
ncbi:MAG: HAD family hydrolase [Myxococcales bacterium]|jgi:HAD superfamily hydrolase (TIGR01509 family)|nr:HAD family hydrolase [Myxococcales bacterium]